MSYGAIWIEMDAVFGVGKSTKFLFQVPYIFVQFLFEIKQAKKDNFQNKMSKFSNERNEKQIEKSSIKPVQLYEASSQVFATVIQMGL